MSEKLELPWVSVITVVRNGEAYIEKTIQSVLSQTYPRIDFVVIDGKSEDGTLKIIRKYEDRLRWISESDKGIYDAMNKGISMAKGNWLNFLNGGDTYVAGGVVQQLFEGKDLEHTHLIYGDSINVENKETRYINAKLVSRNSLKKYLGLCHQALFVKRDFCPLYDLKYRYKAEYNWVIDIVDRIAQENISHIKLPIVYYALGGFSEKGAIKNLREFIQLTRSRFGWVQVLLNAPIYIVVFLRFIKYKFVRSKF